jgi:hypothetical protein
VNRLTALATVAALFMTGAAGPENDVRRVITAYLEADRTGDIDRAYALHSSHDRSQISLEEYRKKFGDRAGVQKAIQSRAAFSITKIEIDGDSATVSVTKRVPDPSSVSEELRTAAAENRTPNVALIRERLLNRKTPLIEEHSLHYLVREKDGWKRYYGFTRD